MGEAIATAALAREDSRGAHFRAEHEADGEALRDDDLWAFVSAWGVPGDGRYVRHAEPLTFDAVPLTRRNYK